VRITSSAEFVTIISPGRDFASRTESVRTRVLPGTEAALALVTILFIASCRTAPTNPQLPPKPTKHSAAVSAYYKEMEDRLGSIWYGLVKNNQGVLHLGTVNTTFEIAAAGGKVRNLRVVSNTGGRMDEWIARRAINQLRAPPIPQAVLSEIQEDYLLAEESFTVVQKPST
jgi:hypothetical protein